MLEKLGTITLKDGLECENIIHILEQLGYKFVKSDHTYAFEQSYDMVGDVDRPNKENFNSDYKLVKTTEEI